MEVATKIKSHQIKVTSYIYEAVQLQTKDRMS